MGQSDILLVGHGFPLLYPLSKALECEGFSVCLTEMWEEALQALTRNLFDLVIVKLPFQRTTDSHIFKLIKKVNSSAKLIVLSDSEQLPIEVFEIEVDDYIILPCRPAEIGRRILVCLNHGKSSSEAEQTQARLNAINTKVLYKLGLMFHDIRGSLVSIDAGMKLLKRRANGKVEGDYMQLLKDIQWKTKKLLNFTDEFLNSTFRSQEYTEIEVVRDLIDPVLEEFRKDLRQRQLAVDIHLNVDSLRGISVIGNRK
jgi:ActR/RegA family two-component response regulator